MFGRFLLYSHRFFFTGITSFSAYKPLYYFSKLAGRTIGGGATKFSGRVVLLANEAINERLKMPLSLNTIVGVVSKTNEIRGY